MKISILIPGAQIKKLIFIILILTSQIIFAQELSIKNLQNGDIIFWAVYGQLNRAGHVAVVTNASNNQKEILKAII